MTHAWPPLHNLEISPREVADLRAENRDFLLMDCRTEEESELAKLQGDELIPMLDLDLHMPKLSAQKDRMIVIYCHTGRRSLILTKVLRESGFTNVKSMAGGIERYSLEIDQSVPRYEKSQLSG